MVRVKALTVMELESHALTGLHHAWSNQEMRRSRRGKGPSRYGPCFPSLVCGSPWAKCGRMDTTFCLTSFIFKIAHVLSSWTYPYDYYYNTILLCRIFFLFLLWWIYIYFCLFLFVFFFLFFFSWVGGWMFVLSLFHNEGRNLNELDLVLRKLLL